MFVIEKVQQKQMLLLHFLVLNGGYIIVGMVTLLL